MNKTIQKQWFMSRVIRYQSSICVQKVVNSVKYVIHCAAFETESLFSLVIKIFNNKNFSDVQIHRKKCINACNFCRKAPDALYLHLWSNVREYLSYLIHLLPKAPNQINKYLQELQLLKIIYYLIKIG